MCPSVPTSSDGVITVHWSYTHTGGLDLTQVIITATKGDLATELDVPNGNLTDLSQTYLNISTFIAGFEYTFTVTAYNELGSSTVQCNPVTHQIGKLCYFNHICRLSQLHQSGIIIRSLRNASIKGFLKFHPRASSLVKLVSSLRSPIWLHYWHFYHKYVTKPFPELMDVLKRRLGLIKREASQHFDFKVFRRLV